LQIKSLSLASIGIGRGDLQPRWPAMKAGSIKQGISLVQARAKSDRILFKKPLARTTGDH
jgi:hypothetical protein